MSFFVSTDRGFVFSIASLIVAGLLSLSLVYRIGSQKIKERRERKRLEFDEILNGKIAECEEWINQRITETEQRLNEKFSDMEIRNGAYITAIFEKLKELEQIRKKIFFLRLFKNLSYLCGVV